MKRFALTCALIVVFALLTSHVALASPPQQGGGVTHYVQAGESLYDIAARYGVSIEAIMHQNGIVNPDMIYAGQTLVIPGGYNPGPMHPGSDGCVSYYTVQMGDTLSGIAWNFGVTTEALMRLNNLRNADFVFVGQPLCVPASGGHAPHPDGYGDHGFPPGFTPAPVVVAPKPWLAPLPSACGCDTPSCVCPPPPPPPAVCGCSGPNCRPDKPCFEIRHLSQEYEQWHRPANGLGACVNEDGPYDVIRPPVTRFTIGIWLVNNSPEDIPGNWAYNPAVVFETKNGQWREACAWNPGTFNPAAKANGGKSVVITFFTHLEQGDYIKDIHFLGLPGAPCFDPGNESIKSCNPVSPPPGTIPELAFPSYPPGTADVTPDTVFSSHS